MTGQFPSPSPSPSSECLIVFTRYPEAGTTKSRMIPLLGAIGAAHLQRQLTLHTLAQAKRVCSSRNASLEVRFAGGNECLMSASFGIGNDYRAQCDGDLGARLQHAFAEATQREKKHVIAIGSDCPELDCDVLQDGFHALCANDLVLGAASDGGYYLIGMHKPHPELFRDMPWSSNALLRETIRKAKAAGLSIHMLKELSDLDHPEDLDLWRRVRSNALAGNALPKISVIIPALNESLRIASALDTALVASGIEVIVVDGGSNDDTAQIARAYGVTVLESAPGRARQMNAGAMKATGDILLFLHSDSRLPADYREQIVCIMAQPEVSAGAFRLRIDERSAALRLVEYFINLRSKYLMCPYGDQSLFMTSDTFNALNGYANYPVMEDYDMIRRLHKRGQIAIAQSACETSARRWQAHGVLRTTLMNQLCVASYLMGVSPDRIAKWRAGGNQKISPPI